VRSSTPRSSKFLTNQHKIRKSRTSGSGFFCVLRARQAVAGNRAGIGKGFA
jgi:hypothetical protein